MNLPDLKALDKLIALCRKRGIKTVKMGELELTLSDDAPAPQRRSKAAQRPHESPGEPESFDLLSEEERLFWSSGGDGPTAPEEDK